MGAIRIGRDRQVASVRIFGFAAFLTLAILLAVVFGLGFAALVSVLILSVIELTFSFDNAIVNAKILERLSSAWQTAFLTIGIIIAIFAVRFILPIVIVALGADLWFNEVLSLAINHPSEYADKLVSAHALIASFGGAFLLTLALEFFINDDHRIFWWSKPEVFIKRLSHFWVPAALTLVVVLALSLTSRDSAVLKAGVLGVVVYLALQVAVLLFSRNKTGGTKQLAGWAGLSLFLYLQVLDASFSLDGVIGAFAITNDVLLIAAGLGIGALWVRSLTIFMVRRGTLRQYKFLEHGAYYTILALASSFFVSLFIEVPDIVTGLISISIIGAAIASSIRSKKLVGAKSPD